MREGGGDRQEESSDQLTATATAATRPHRAFPHRQDAGKGGKEGGREGGRALGKPLSPTLLTVSREEDRERGGI